MFLDAKSGMKRIDAFNKKDSKRQAILITAVLSGKE